jgi:hypothetical protein
MSNVTNNVQSHAARPAGALTVQALADARKLPAQFLRELGLCDLPNDRAVGIPYYDETGLQLLMRRRTALEAKAGSHQPKNVPVCAYGQWRIHETAKTGVLILVEGESDCWTLWHHGLPALGLPGSGMARTLTRDLLAYVQKLYLVREPDQGGKSFQEGVIDRLGELRYRGQTFILTMPEGCKDPSDLHIASPEKFLGRFHQALSAACPAAPRDKAAGTRNGPAANEEPSQHREAKLLVVNLADVPIAEVRWLWPDRIPLGKLTILDGDPGLGKSSVTLDIAARLTRGLPMPNAPPESALPPSSVVLLTAEDGLGDAIRPRLEAAGACLAKVNAMQGFDNSEGMIFPITLPMDVRSIAKIVEMTQAKLVLIDPLMAYLHESVQAHNDQSVRRALLPLAQLAENSGAAVVVVRHLNKQPSKNINYRGGGSIGIIGAARSGLIVCKDADAPHQRLLGVSKCNLCKPPRVLRYEVAAEGKSSRVLWLGESNADIEKLFAAQAGNEAAAGNDADEFLKALLAQGPVPATVIAAEAAKLDIKGLRGAKRRLRIKSVRVAGTDRPGMRWVWRMPAPPKSEPAD